MIEYKLVSFFFYLDFKRKEKIILYVLVKDYKLRRFSFDLKNKNISIFSLCLALIVNWKKYLKLKFFLLYNHKEKKTCYCELKKNS